MKRLFAWLWKYLKPFTNIKFAISFGLAWMITNGIWYVFAFVPMGLPDWLVWFSRSYIAFLYLPFTPVIQIDCIESGKPFKTALLTIHFTDLRFMLGFLMPVKDSENVSKVFLQLQQMLSPEEYKAIFPVILTDRGTEFSNPLAIETHYETGELLTQVFFCDPQASNQKGHIEENHTLVRYVIPRSTNLTNYTQNNIDLLLSHLNSYGRALLGTTPYHLFEIYYGKAILDKIKVKFIQPDQVYLKPDLFSR